MHDGTASTPAMRTVPDGIFSGDGMIHAMPFMEIRRTPIKGRRDIINAVSFADAAVCLDCDALFCDGERKCFESRKKAIGSRKKAIGKSETVSLSMIADREADISGEYLDIVAWLDDMPGPMFSTIEQRTVPV